MQQYHIGTIDFCFKNTRSYPIKIESSVKRAISSYKDKVNIIRGKETEKLYNDKSLLII